MNSALRWGISIAFATLVLPFPLLAQDSVVAVKVLPNPVPADTPTTLFVDVSSSTGDFDINAVEIAIDGQVLDTVVVGAGTVVGVTAPLAEGTHAMTVTDGNQTGIVPIDVRPLIAANLREGFLRELVLVLDDLVSRQVITTNAYRTVRAEVFHAGSALWANVARAVEHLERAQEQAERHMPDDIATPYVALLGQGIDIVSEPFPPAFLQDIEAQKELLIQQFFQNNLAVDDNGALVFTASKADAVALAQQLREVMNGAPDNVNEGSVTVTVEGQEKTVVWSIGRNGRAGDGEVRNGRTVTATGGDVNFAVGGHGADGSAEQRGGDGGAASAAGGAVAIAVAGNGGHGGNSTDAGVAGNGGNGGVASASPTTGGRGFCEAGKGGDGGDGVFSRDNGGNGGEGGPAEVNGNGQAQAGNGGAGGDGHQLAPPGSAGNGGSGGEARVRGDGDAEGGDGADAGTAGGSGANHPGGDGGRGGSAGRGIVDGTGHAMGGQGGNGSNGGPSGTGAGGIGGSGGAGADASVGAGGTATGGDGGDGGTGAPSDQGSGGRGGNSGQGGDARGPSGTTLDPGESGVPGGGGDGFGDRDGQPGTDLRDGRPIQTGG